MNHIHRQPWLLLAALAALAMYFGLLPQAHAQTGCGTLVDCATPAPAPAPEPVAAGINAPISATAWKSEEWAFAAVLTADYLQSMDIHRTAGLIETNAILGEHPNEAKITAYFISAGVLHWLVTKELVREHVPAFLVHGWEAGTIGLEASVVKRNASLGIRFYVP